MAEMQYWVWFQQMFGIGTRRSHLLMEYFPDPQALYEEIRAGGKAGSMLTEKEKDSCQKALQQAEQIVQATYRKTCRILTPQDAEYPALLQAIYAKPAALYVKGDLNCLKDKLAIALVGSRDCSEYGAAAARQLAEGLAELGVVVVSGLAHGIDTAAHAAALAKNGESIGVMGCGIDIDYPSGNREIKSAMRKNGAVISEFPMGTPVRGPNFPIRNRIISGISHGVVVVEAAAQSGAVITAQHALEQGREVFGVPGSIFDAQHCGVHQLLRDGAKLVQQVADIIEEYPAFGIYLPQERLTAPHLAQSTVLPAPKEPNPPAEAAHLRYDALPGELSEEARKLCMLLDGRSCSVQALCTESGQDMGELLAALTELEIYRLVESLPGRQYRLVRGAAAGG